MSTRLNVVFHVVISYIKGDFVKINIYTHKTFEYIIIRNNNNNNTPDEISTRTILKIAASVLVHPSVTENMCV